MAATDLGSLRGRARDALNQLAGVTPENLAEAKGLVEELRNAREYERMGQLAEAVSRQDPGRPEESAPLRAVPHRHRPCDRRR
jgi:hypothetical protein